MVSQYIEIRELIMKKGLLIYLLLITAASLQAQICNNATDTVYSLNSITGSGSGQIIGVNVNNAGTKLIGSPAASSANANGAGFSQVTGLFYFFNQCAAGTTEFVSYNPLTGSKAAKTIPTGLFPAGPVIPTTSTGKIRSGTVNKDGTGYYTIFPGATTAMGYPATAPAFLYYGIGTNTWTCITQKFKDVSGNIVTPLQSLNSGDMSFDGNDNLWILCSSSSSYALYRIKAPLPITYLGSSGFVTVDTMIPVTSTPGSVSFTGIAFNSAGKLFLSTGSYSSPPGIPGNNQLYYLSSLTSPLVTVGTLPNGYGDDLTSCSFPLQVLASHWIDFRASSNANGVSLHWKIDEEVNTTGYDIEYSSDADHWNVIGHLSKDNFTFGINEYSWLYKSSKTGRIFFRVVETNAAGKQSFSGVASIDFGISNELSLLGPNPVKKDLYFTGNTTLKHIASIYDNYGRLVLTSVISPGQQSLNMQHLPNGIYLLQFQTPGLTEDKSKVYRFIKMQTATP
jgi:hypothetical protein